MGILWEWYQSERIGEAQSSADEAQRRTFRAEEDAARLRADVDRLQLLTHALWTLLREKTGLTDEQLAERVRDVDLSDGKLDGRVHVPAGPCPECGRTVSSRRPRCMYCGTALSAKLP